MKKIFFILSLFTLVLSIPASAQQEKGSKRDRAKFVAELRNYKHEFLSEELSLTKEQEKEFFPVYDEMEDETERINNETRELERKTDSDENATDLEYETVSRAIFEQKSKEGQVEMEYYDKFKSILSPRQLFLLKGAERKFTQGLMKQHRRLASKNARNQ